MKCVDNETTTTQKKKINNRPLVRILVMVKLNEKEKKRKENQNSVRCWVYDNHPSCVY